MSSFFIHVYYFFEKRKIVFYTFFLTSFLFVLFFATKVKFEEDISTILPKDKKIEKINEVFKNSKFLDKLVLTISLKDSMAPPQPDSLVAYADWVVGKINEKLQPYVAKLNDKIDDDLAMNLYGSINQHLPVYLTEKDYTKIDSLITPLQLKATLAQDFKTLTSPAGLALKQQISLDPVGISFLGLKKLQQLQYDDNFELYDNYIVTKNQRNLILFITPTYPASNTGKNTLFLKGLDSIFQSTLNNSFKNISASYFGAVAVSAGNALQLRKDSLLTQGITVLFIIVFLGMYFRKKRAPLLILIPVLFGALFSLATIYFIKGNISVIALGTGSVVLGIAINYSLHVFNHYKHTGNIKELLHDLAMPMTIGSFTTIGGFFCLQFVQSEMLKDLGLFAAFSLIGASLASLIFLPHLMVSKKDLIKTNQVSLNWLDKIVDYNPAYNKYFALIILVLTIVFAVGARLVGFQTDLLSMNYMTPKLKLAEQQLNKINAYSLQSVYLVSDGNTFNEALKNNEKISKKLDSLENQNIVAKYSGVGTLILSDSLQKARIEKWNNYFTSSKKQTILTTLKKEGQALKFSLTAFDNFSNLLNKSFEPIDTAEMAMVRNNLLADYIIEKPNKFSVINLVKVTQQNKNTLYHYFENDDNVTVLDKQYLTNKFVEIINADFSKIALMTSLLVFIVLLLMYGRLELTLVSFIPMAISWVWILGIMGYFGIQFNIINIIVSALIFGLGDDYSLFIMDGLLQEYKTGRKSLTSFKSSIYLSAITTVAGLGVLIFAKHPALKSIAAISIIGIVCVVIMSQILIPYLFSILITNRTKKGLAPWTLFAFIKSSFAFSYFISWSFLLNHISWLFRWFGAKQKGKYVFHYIIAKASKRLMYVMINVKKVIINPQNEKFEKPAIIISNHQSSLDIVPLLMLHPKLIMFTNNRIWNSPLFGSVIQLADYFPAEKVETDMELVAEKIKQGYSVIIFPEGTRSEDGRINRFHKGAFYLAEKLQVDILPILLHGTDYTLTKKDQLLKDGQVTLKYLPRITPTNTAFGNNYSERAKQVGKYFREEYNALKTKIEKPVFFRQQLIFNYIYKGPVLEWYMRIKTRLEKNYQLFHEIIPANANILDIGCGYGFMPYMLGFAAPNRKILGIDYDEEKIEVAKNGYSKTTNINFETANILHFNFEKYDAIIIADVLHYLQPQDQILILEKCIKSLNVGGVLMIRDGDKEIAKHKMTILSEIFSTKIFKFNKTNKNSLSFLAGSELEKIAKLHGLQISKLETSKKTSNVIWVMINTNSH